MRENAERRLAELRAEIEAGQRMLGELESQETHLRKSLLRIAGAVQVLEELLAGEAGDASHASALPVRVPDAPLNGAGGPTSVAAAGHP